MVIHIIRAACVLMNLVPVLAPKACEDLGRAVHVPCHECNSRLQKARGSALTLVVVVYA